MSTKTVLESCYTPTEDETKTYSFKARLDVYKQIGGLLEKVAVSIKGKEIVSNVHKTPLFSSVSTSLSLNDYTGTRQGQSHFYCVHGGSKKANLFLEIFPSFSLLDNHT